ncbi:MAG: Fur family transcriptional regulator [Oscillospiraceae bacterium]|nr:Fur family transcriptional regulator [Oscillospiraceae bacterium]
MATYQTEQKNQLCAFLKAHSETAFTAGEIAQKMEAEGYSPAPGKSTVYRLLPKLVECGAARCFSEENSRTLKYQAVAGERCHHHLHLKCTGCGKILHMSEEASEQVLKQVLLEDSFRVDREHTMLFGVCAQCEAQEVNGGDDS